MITEPGNEVCRLAARLAMRPELRLRFAADPDRTASELGVELGASRENLIRLVLLLDTGAADLHSILGERVASLDRWRLAPAL